ncbi:Fic family protein [Flavobacterium reichenbachii]|uniref:Cell filamentation protein Fic n=1 Tax=Flavobacterium reichenbachii TaxID=362418 RepID=A0A085ZPF4_9FLAO|nr:Fic family protein [Flavobacterium reichenbachii]KFF06318.1 cell filamentation protein Fic [Flavobacterium reichenbachii]OXB17468.1 cell filamentation protein Fic [Flavobacterium reichenbachii]
MDSKRFSLKISVFHGIKAPEEGTLVGYGALIEAYSLSMPIPNQLALISSKKRQYTSENWQVLTSRHEPEDTLYKQLVFALKYEGINLLFFKKLFETLTEQEITALVQIEPQGQYSRKIWFLYEWLSGKTLPIPDLEKGNFVTLIDEDIQFGLSTSTNSSRHRIKNNLPGTVDFCPLIHKTEKLTNYINENLSNKKNSYLKAIHKDVLQRASAFLLLKDSKASFTIEGENPTNTRAVRWGKAIGQAGSKPLDKEELLRLQQIVIENSRFIEMGFRTEGGFVGEHERTTGEPIPEHISAKWEDIDILINGLFATYEKMEESKFDAVLAGATIAFGFVFIHPFVDGNGRIHRYLMHHILSKMQFAQQGIIFPVSASILNHIDDYRLVLESYSHPILDFIEWKKTKSNNIEVLNDTIDFYRYFDATKQAEFLYDCVNDTIENVIPQEVDYLQKYDEMKSYLDDIFQMPDKMVALLIRFLEQNNGKLSKRALEKEFSALTEEEVKEIEEHYQLYFN